MASLLRSTTPWASFLGALVVLGLSSCGGQSSYDLYLAAMKAHGEAERGSCRLVFDSAEQAHIINSSRVASCLQDVRDVEALYEKAGAHGYSGKELERAKLKLRTEIERLESMLRTIQMMERESELERGKLP